MPISSCAGLRNGLRILGYFRAPTPVPPEKLLRHFTLANLILLWAARQTHARLISKLKRRYQTAVSEFGPWNASNSLLLVSRANSPNRVPAQLLARLPVGKMGVTVDTQVAAPAEMRTSNLYRAKSRSIKSADGRMATEAARLERKEPQEGRKNILDSYRPSHGRS